MTSTTSARRRLRWHAVLTLICLAPLGIANGQSLDRYLDDNGNWVFSDRQPADGSPFESVDVERAEQPGVVRLYQRPGPEAGSLILAAENTFHGTVQIAFEVAGGINLAATMPTRGNRVLEPRSDTPLLVLRPAEPDRSVQADFRYQYIHGDPAARHEPAEPYRLPYALASSYRVSQAYPDALTHTDPPSEHAVDFEMPIGTNVFAARGGTVLDVATDFFEAGVEERLLQQANLIRILHDDGTMAIYAHLNWNSIRVVPGQEIEKGEYIADSGNTGFSSGPHLHFVVQQNIGGEIISVPVEFAAPAAVSFNAVTGQTPVAY